MHGPMNIRPLHNLFPCNPLTPSHIISLQSTHPFTLYFLTIHTPLHTLFPYNPHTPSHFISSQSTHPFTLFPYNPHTPSHFISSQSTHLFPHYFLTIHTTLHTLFPHNPHIPSHIISLTIHSHVYSLFAYNSVTRFQSSLIIHCSNPRKHVIGVTDSLEATTCLSKCFADFST